MKQMKFLIAILLGLAGTLTYQWFKPPFGNPYFFLSPKITVAEPIDIPIKLYKKNEEVNFLFWNTPLPEERFLLITELQSPSSHIVLKVTEEKNIHANFHLSDLFYNDGPLGDIQDSPIFNVELYKINADLTNQLIEQTIINKKKLGGVYSLMPLDNLPYGQYRIKVKVLGDWPELKIDGLNYFVSIQTYYAK